MGSNMAVRNRIPFWQLEAFRVLLLQLTVSFVLAGAVALIQGGVSGYSVALGGTVAWLPNAWFIRKAFRFQGARSMPETVQSLWSGLAGKMILTMVLFALSFVVVQPLNVAGLFAGFVLVQLTGAASLLIMKDF